MSILSGLATPKELDQIEKEVDSLGGAPVLESDVYLMTIKRMFITVANSGAKAINIHATTQDGKEFRTTQYITSSTAKGGKISYERNGKTYFLPGYSICNAICLLAIGKSLTDETLEIEDRVVKLYDFDAKQEVPTSVPMIIEMCDQNIALGIIKEIVDKTKKNDSTGEYENTGETREQNEVKAVFCPETGLTKTEKESKQEEPEFLTKWKEKNAGKVINTAKGLEGSTGAISGTKGKASAAKPSKSLFGNKK